MSYEGYEQHICANGHRFDNHIYGDEEPRCYRCGAESVWFNSVDDTNCDQFGYIPLFRDFAYGQIAIPSEKEKAESRTYCRGHKMYYCANNKRFRVQLFVICEYEDLLNTGSGNTMAQYPCNNPCIEV